MSVAALLLAAPAVPAAAQVTTRASVGPGGVQGDDHSGAPAISADGRFLAFSSAATNLVAGDTNALIDIFVRDRISGTTERVSVGAAGAQANAASGGYGLSISADGSSVVFSSNASNLVAGDTNATTDVFLRDRWSGVTLRVSVDSAGVQGNAGSYQCAVSAGGRYVAFSSLASNLVVGDTNGVYDIFVRDLLLGTTERVSVDSAGAQATGDSLRPSISGDGRYVAFESFADNLVAGDTNGVADIFVRDRTSGTTERVSVDSGVLQGNAASANPWISTGGRFVAFASDSSNLVGGDANGITDVFLRDRQLGSTAMISVDPGGLPGNETSQMPAVSGDGRFVAFESNATGLVGGDTNVKRDVFVRDRSATGFTSLCHPGQGGVMACPCSNPPSGTPRGCDNSSGTGGAFVFATGVAYLSLDTIVFSTSGEKPTALSIVLQGNGFLSDGVVYGQGVRCVGGSLKRLYAKSASGGSITAPEFAAGELSVSAQSAVKGDVILPGQPRWYTVYYRDPIVLGGCPSSSTFNATQTGQVSWSP